ncbi:MAG: alpha amylase C-terminal domain-containing protein, partial [Flavitalea sp.]
IEWNGQYKLSNFYKILLGQRTSFGKKHATAALLDTGPNSNIIAFVKYSDVKQMVVLINLSGAVQITSINNDLVSGDYKDVFDGTIKEAPSLMNFTMEPWSYLVLDKV